MKNLFKLFKKQTHSDEVIVTENENFLKSDSLNITFNDDNLYKISVLLDEEKISKIYDRGLWIMLFARLIKKEDRNLTNNIHFHFEKYENSFNKNTYFITSSFLRNEYLLLEKQVEPLVDKLIAIMKQTNLMYIDQIKKVMDCHETSKRIIEKIKYMMV